MDPAPTSENPRVRRVGAGDVPVAESGRSQNAAEGRERLGLILAQPFFPEWLVDPACRPQGLQHREDQGARVCRHVPNRSEERRVGKACRSRWSSYHYKKNCITL